MCLKFRMLFQRTSMLLYLISGEHQTDTSQHFGNCRISGTGVCLPVCVCIHSTREQECLPTLLASARGWSLVPCNFCHFYTLMKSIVRRKSQLSYLSNDKALVFNQFLRVSSEQFVVFITNKLLQYRKRQMKEDTVNKRIN